MIQFLDTFIYYTLLLTVNISYLCIVYYLVILQLDKIKKSYNIGNFSPKYISSTRFKSLNKSIVFLLISFIVLSSYSKIIDTIAINEVQDFLDKTDLKTEVYIDGKLSSQPMKIIKDIKNRKRKISLDNNLITHEIEIVIQNRNKSIKLILGKNPEDKNQYLVFYPHYQSTKTDELWSIRTDVFL